MSNNKISLEVGDSFIFKNENGTHLHVIVAESSPIDSATIMLIYLSTSDIPNKDITTMIEIGEHPFVTQRSWVRYQNIIICERSLAERNILKYYGKVDTKLFDRIQDGIMKSNFVPKHNRELFTEWKMNKLFGEI